MSGSERPAGVGVPAALEGVGLILWHVLISPFVGSRRRRWGSIGTEATDPLPGDELVPQPRWSYTWAIGVDAEPDAVWPWVAQLGQGRGGFYTYQTLENVFGCRITNTAEILPEHQHPEVGGEIHLHPSVPMRIETVDPPYALVLFGSPSGSEPAEKGGVSTWQFVIVPTADGASRLLTRGRYDHTPDWQSRLAFGPLLVEPISFVMSRKMLREIKRLAERPVSGR